ncbi:hypothetical protein PENSPDRAFT_343108 [Peniophora sp. CONT]|nr:hypothetical protein PENSPDRAFT_343108 [Peniophora sp. CONT]
MPDWRGPAEATRDSLFLAKILYACFGCATWEYFSHLDYEWDVLRGKRSYRWTIWVYSACRLSMLLAFLLLIILTSGWVTHDCSAPYAAGMFFTYLTIALASLLLILRIAAVWKRNIIIMTVSIIVWLSCIALNIRDLTLVRALYSASVGSCISFDAYAFLPNAAGVLGSDALLLGLTLVGLLRMREDRKFGIARFLYRQGIVWLIVAVLVEVPVVILSALNLNDPLILMLQPVELLSLGVCATAMYRALTNYSPGHVTSLPLTPLRTRLIVRPVRSRSPTSLDPRTNSQ